MAAYAALVSLMHIIDNIEHHHSPPISMDKKQVESLTEIITFLQEFLQDYSTSVADDDDEADPLETRIIDAAYAAEDLIESNIVDVIKLSRFSSGEENVSGEKLRSSSGEEENSREEVSCINWRQILLQMLEVVSYQDQQDLLQMLEVLSYQDQQGVIEEMDASTSSAENDSGEKSRSSSGEEVNSREEVSCINLYQDLHQVIEEMDLIKKVAMKIDAEKTVSASIVSLRSSSSSSSSPEQNNSSMMLCSDDVLHGIMEKLVAGRPDRQFIPVVGMDGIDKTTLARTVYSKPLIKEHFDICVWATISQQYNIREILCELLSQKGEQSERCEQELGSVIYKYLFGRRFLIVMDDMWSIDAWDKIQCFFPNNANGSRILATTRLSQLSSQLNNNYIFETGFLDELSSWDLFSKTVFGEESCLLELMEIGKEIVKICRGLPFINCCGGRSFDKNGTHSGMLGINKEQLNFGSELENDKHCLRL